MTEAIEQLKQLLEETEPIVIGAGSGLSTSAGFTYSGERFEKYFSDFAAKYGFQDMYSGGFTPFTSLEERWAYWSRYIMINRYMNPPKPVYTHLLSLVQGKDYFVLTTNVDHCFQKAGFNKERLFYTQGDYGLFQCSEPCHQKKYDNEKQIRAMWEFRREMKIPSALVPYCPVCGKPMSMNLRADDTFVTDESWHRASDRYTTFLQSRNIVQTTQQGGDGKVLFLELGVGRNTPGIIKYPFWQMTAQNPNARYACINFGEAFVPYEIQERAICINDDIGKILQEIVQ